MLTRRLRVKVSAAEELVELVHIFVLVCGWCLGWLGVSGVLVLLLFVGERCDFDPKRTNGLSPFISVS